MKLVKCGECNRNYYFQPQHRYHGEIIELGTICQHCEKWLHVAFTNEELLKRQQGLRNNRQRRAYKRDFEKWQVEAKEMLAELEKV